MLKSPVKTLIACGQFSPVAKNLSANAALMRGQAHEAAACGASIIVFPELCLTGYLTPDEVPPLSVGLRSEEIGRLAETARHAGVSLCFGFAERAPDGRLLNSMAFIGKDGGLKAVYRKVHLWEGESRWAAAGDGFSCFDAGQFRAGMAICYDMRFPETARALALQGATAVLAASAWLGPAEEWELVLRARAVDNGMFVAGAALQGSYRELAFHGTSAIVSPHGVVIARAGEGRDEVIAACYDSEEVGAFRARLPLLRHRRTSSYGPLDAAGDWPGA